MESFVIHLSNDRLMSNLFWRLAEFAPYLLAALLTLLFLASWRRTAMAALAVGLACAVSVALVFHFTYVTAIWGRHDSAVRSLDQSALLAGFTAGATAVMLVAAACAIVRSAVRFPKHGKP